VSALLANINSSYKDTAAIDAFKARAGTFNNKKGKPPLKRQESSAMVSVLELSKNQTSGTNHTKAERARELYEALINARSK